MIERQGQCHLCEGDRNSKTAVDVETKNTLQSREVYQKDSAEYENMAFCIRTQLILHN